MNEQDIVNKLKSDPRALKSVMQSQDGKALLNMLSGGNSAALGQAARQAASGDTAALSAMLSRVLSSPQGAELVQRLESKLQQSITVEINDKMRIHMTILSLYRMRTAAANRCSGSTIKKERQRSE